MRLTSDLTQSVQNTKWLLRKPNVRSGLINGHFFYKKNSETEN
jgi:hypothetical protein